MQRQSCFADHRLIVRVRSLAEISSITFLRHRRHAPFLNATATPTLTSSMSSTLGC